MTRKSVVSSVLVAAAAVVPAISLGQSLDAAEPAIPSCQAVDQTVNQTAQVYSNTNNRDQCGTGRDDGSSGPVRVPTGSYPTGYSAKMFYGIPGFASGLRVKKSGYADVSATQRNFLVKNNGSATDFQWYADCTTTNQVYDGQTYWGDDPEARSLMAYACSLPSTVKAQSRR